MTNKQAINILLNEQKCIDRNDGVQCNRKCGSCDLVMDVETIREAYNMAISALETNVGDMISRQAAIDAFDCTDELIVSGIANAQNVMNYINKVVGKINALPSAQPEPQWIPCSERMPEPRVAVLGYAPRYKNIFALYYDSVMGWMVWSPIRDDCFPNSQGEIVAWMPLPSPYQAERREG